MATTDEPVIPVDGETPNAVETPLETPDTLKVVVDTGIPVSPQEPTGIIDQSVKVFPDVPVETSLPEVVKADTPEDKETLTADDLGNPLFHKNNGAPDDDGGRHYNQVVQPEPDKKSKK